MHIWVPYGLSYVWLPRWAPHNSPIKKKHDITIIILTYFFLLIIYDLLGLNFHYLFVAAHMGPGYTPYICPICVPI